MLLTCPGNKSLELILYYNLTPKVKTMSATDLFFLFFPKYTECTEILEKDF